MAGSSWEPITELASKVNSGEVKAATLVEKSLANIEANQEFKAIIATTKDRAV